jgi:hypothetical protein
MRIVNILLEARVYCQFVNKRLTPASHSFFFISVLVFGQGGWQGVSVY